MSVCVCALKINQHTEKHPKFVYKSTNKYVHLHKYESQVDSGLSFRWNSPVQVVHYVGVFVFPHHQDLIDDQLFLGLLLQVHLLDGHLSKENRYP